MKKFYIENYGCQMNKADSTSVVNSLTESGVLQTEDYKESDYIIINTCSVREHAENRVFSRVMLFASFKKRENKKLKIIVMGCMAKTSKVKLYSLGADKVFDVYNENKISSFILGEDVKETPFGEYYEFNKAYVDEDYKYRAFLPISHGCDNWCTYCIVPYTRGAMVSRKSGEIIEELKKLIYSGAREIMLLGQNVNSYGIDTKDKTFSDLLYDIDKTIGSDKVWIRFMTSHPKDFDKTVSDAIFELKSLVKSLHLPFQSGSNRILEIMNRKYTREEYLTKVSYLRSRDRFFNLSTDVLVGFADESEEDFSDTLSLLKEVVFEEAYLYKYSQRANSVAHKKNIKYNEELGQERLSKIIEYQRSISQERLKHFVGSSTQVMIGHIAKDKKNYSSRSYEGRIILIASQNEKLNEGHIYNVKISSVKNHTLFGEIIKQIE